MASRMVLSDADNLATRDDIPWDVFDGKTVVVTGATGLIGTAMVATLLRRSEVADAALRVVALVRNPAKANQFFGSNRNMTVRKWSAESPQVAESDVPEADFIFHCANMTDSSSFVEKPVETIETTLGGGAGMLQLARRTNAKLILFSTMETYGSISLDHAVKENEGGFLDAMSLRNSYPEAKRLCEALCTAYASEYGTQAAVLRLVQTFGPGVQPDDKRVFAEFARDAIAGRDIVLLTDGKKTNSYLYTTDAISAALFVAAKGTPGTAYNAANDATYCSILEMASMVAEDFSRGRSKVHIQLDPSAERRFRKGGTLRLDVSRLQALGWAPSLDLTEMYDRLIKDWQETDD